VVGRVRDAPAELRRVTNCDRHAAQQGLEQQSGEPLHVVRLTLYEGRTPVAALLVGDGDAVAEKRLEVAGDGADDDVEHLREGTVVFMSSVASTSRRWLRRTRPVTGSPLPRPEVWTRPTKSATTDSSIESCLRLSAIYCYSRCISGDNIPMCGKRTCSDA